MIRLAILCLALTTGCVLHNPHVLDSVPLSSSCLNYPRSWADPVFVLLESDPVGTTGAIRFDTPSLALYADGAVIIQDPAAPDATSSYVAAQLSPESLQQLTSLANVEDLWKLDETSYDIAGSATDMPHYEIHLWRNGKHKRIEIRGPVRYELEGEDMRRRGADSSRHSEPMFAEGLRRARSREPDAKVVKAFEVALRAGPMNTCPWQAERIEVILNRGPDHPEKAPVPWPKRWPSLDSAGGSEMRTFFIPGDDLRTVVAIARMRAREDRPVGTQQSAWWMRYRLPYPHEDAWLSPNADEFTRPSD